MHGCLVSEAPLQGLNHPKGGTMDVKVTFDGFDPTEPEAEAQARWGDSDAYRESARRTKRYGPAE